MINHHNHVITADLPLYHQLADYFSDYFSLTEDLPFLTVFSSMVNGNAVLNWHVFRIRTFDKLCNKIFSKKFQCILPCVMWYDMF